MQEMIGITAVKKQSVKGACAFGRICVQRSAANKCSFNNCAPLALKFSSKSDCTFESSIFVLIGHYCIIMGLKTECTT